MLHQAWRLVRPLQSFAYSAAVASTTAGRYHEAGDRVVYGWSSSEMAFLSLLDLTGRHPPIQMVREKIRLPKLPSKIVHLSNCLESGVFHPQEMRRNPSCLIRQMKRKELLGVWIHSELMPSEQVLVLNPDDPAFMEVTLLSATTVVRGSVY